MKKILGLDLGTTSVGWALVNEAQKQEEKSSIIKLGVRVVPLTTDEQSDYEKGKSITTNADRTLKRSMRRNLQRYKLRRENLIECLIENHIISAEDVLCEEGNRTTFQTYKARARAASEEVTLLEFARILLMINKKRGYKSSRKTKNPEEGQIIDGMAIAEILYNEKITPGEYVLRTLREGKKYIPDFYRSDLNDELCKIWYFQKSFYPEILTDEIFDKLPRKGEKKTKEMFYAIHKLNSADIKGKDRKLEQYKLRVKGLNEKLEKEELVEVLSVVNGAINNSSGYLGAISDRSKELHFTHTTVGQYLMQQLEKNPHFSVKNKTFYRKDYLDEFEQIWETQAKYHKELTPELKDEIRNIIIFYQRPLKSKKGMLDLCTFERWQTEVMEDGKKKTKTIGRKVCPRSSPLFQEFKIWSTINNLMVEEKDTRNVYALDKDEKEKVFHELTYKEKMKKNEILKLLYGKKASHYDLNYAELDGNKTITALYKAFLTIVTMSGHGEYELSKISADDAITVVSQVFEALGINTGILSFDSSLSDQEFEQQPVYLLWHMLYSYEGDDSNSGNETLINNLCKKYGFEREYAALLANVTFMDDYSNLCTKAMRKILPFLKEGCTYDKACYEAGYNHSERSLTREQLDNKELVDHLELLPRNALRNPIVEKILNQMINVVNEVTATYGKPDEIRIEMARELKNSAKERENMTKAINSANALNEQLRKEIEEKFGIQHVSKNDLVRYKLYLELKDNGFKTLYSNTYIPQEKLFTKEFDIEHIIPQARLFDDSFANKTLELRSINLEKSNKTAFDYVLEKYGEEGAEEYKKRVEGYYREGKISQTKRNNLLRKESEIPEDFIDRDLRNSQYIAKKAREILEQMVREVVPTTGSITDRLRQDWQLVNVMQELNWEKYDRLGLTYTFQDKDNHTVKRIKDWTKRNDHRHHAMDALTIAFTKRQFIQYLNNLNACSNQSESIKSIEREYTERIDGKRRFKSPIPLDEFRREARKHLEDILVSIKAKNKVMTWNINRTRCKDGLNKKAQLTPRGQLHNETIYGHTRHRITKNVKVSGKMTADVIALVAKKSYREALMARLEAFGGDAKKAFTGKMSPDKMPVWLNESHTQHVPEVVKIVDFEDYYPIRKEIDPTLKLDKVIDKGVKRVLDARLAEYNGDAKKAFSNLDENPIYLNKEKGITIKRVRVRGVLTALPLHEAKNHHGHVIMDDNNHAIPCDYVQTSGTHHVAIFRDENGNLQDVAVSFYEATARLSMGIPVIDKDYNKSKGWQFLFTMKQNEYFVFPNNETGFNPNDIDLLDDKNCSLISPNLYRVQKLSKVDYGTSCVRQYVFRQHLETSVEERKELKEYAYKDIKSLPYFEGIVKVRVNHIGKIVAVGEY